MVVGRVVPWTSWDEWTAVYEWFFSASPRLQRMAVERVAVWQIRGRVPMSVDVTSAIVEAQLSESQVSSQMLRMQLALSITRLVNGIVDPAQKGKFADSVASLAARAGLPRMLVDIRHQSTHNELPSLPSLRLAASQALQWIRDSYWERQTAHLRTCKDKITATLSEYLTLKAKVSAMTAAGGRPLDEEEGDSPRGDGEMSKASKAEEKKRRQTLLGELKGLIPPAATSILVPALLDSGSLLTPPGRSGAKVDVKFFIWEAAVQDLLREWPSLPSLILSGAVERLLRLLGDASTASGEACRPLQLWLQYVVTAVPPVAAAGVLGEAARGLMAAVGEAEAGRVGAVASSPAARALAASIRALQGAVNAAAKDKSAARERRTALVLAEQALQLCDRLASAQGAGASEPPSKKQKTERAQEERPADAADRLLQEARAAQERAGAAASTRDAGDEESFLWDLCESWAPCPLGSVPSRLNPVLGRLPELSRPTPASLAALERENAASEDHATDTGRAGQADATRTGATAEELYESEDDDEEPGQAPALEESLNDQQGKGAVAAEAEERAAREAAVQWMWGVARGKGEVPILGL